MRRLTGSLRRSLTIKGVPPRDREHELQLLHRAIEAWSDQRHDAAREILSRVHADTRQRQPLLGVLEVALSSDLHVQAKSTPNDALIRGLSLREQGLHEGAFDELSRVEDPALLPLARLARGLSALHSKRWRLAESDLTSVASVFPGSAAVMGGIALARMRQGRPDVALAELELLVRLTPESASAWRAMGETLKELDRIDEAWSALSRAESIEPHDSPDNSVLRASIWARQQRTEDACRLLESVVKQAPNHAGAWRELALARDTSHQVVEAAVAYRRALELNPDDPLILMCFANLCVGADIGRCARCDECFAKNPELIDHVAAQDLLIRSLVATRDENVALLDSIQYVALKLESRGQLLQQLDEVVATCSDSTAQLRLHSLRRQLKLREP